MCGPAWSGREFGELEIVGSNPITPTMDIVERAVLEESQTVINQLQPSEAIVLDRCLRVLFIPGDRHIFVGFQNGLLRVSCAGFAVELEIADPKFTIDDIITAVSHAERVLDAKRQEENAQLLVRNPLVKAISWLFGL